MNKTDFSQYISPLSWRYGSVKMKAIFSEVHKYELWRRIWVALARAQQKAGLVAKTELIDLEKKQKDIDISRILEIEEETKHDVVAAIGEYAQKAKIGGGKIHLGATSMDVVDNADAIRMQEALLIIEKKLIDILHLFAGLIEKYSDTTCIGYTHLQPAEPTTVGYRFAFYAQDILTDLEYLRFIKKTIKGKGMKGAVGTRASYAQILAGTTMTPQQLDDAVSKELGIDFVDISTQVFPRKFDYLFLSALASSASSIAKFAGDLRLLQSPTIGEWSEPFGKKQVGSSAMPFKKNPIHSEKICSLARYIAQLPAVALENATLSYLERTLDDSANKRLIISEGCITLDEILKAAHKIISGLVINTERIAHNLAQFAPFAATESLIIASVKKGANRQEMHELLRQISMTAWAAVSMGKQNPMTELLLQNATLKKYVTNVEVKNLLDVSHHVGDAPGRAKKFAKKIRLLT